MNKLKEILFLKSIKGVGKAKIYKKYWEILNELTDLDDYIAQIEFEFNTPLEELEKAKEKAEKLYDSIINDPEIKVLTVFDEGYPKQLNIMKNGRPLILYIKGNVNALYKPNIAFIGTREPSEISQEFENDLVRNLVNKTDRVVVSGLALGCDRIAHQATVDEEKITIAVLPSGVNVIKPAQNKKLAMEIIEKGGCLVSEYEPNDAPYKSSYVQRDKIVAAFSDATFVVECGVSSGTMHTVDAAKDYNKTIFTYLPDERPKDSFDGNIHILENKLGSVKINNIDEFLNNLDDLIKENDLPNPKKEVSKSSSQQQTLDFF